MRSDIATIGHIWLVGSMLNPDKFWGGVMLVFGIGILVVSVFINQEVSE